CTWANSSRLATLKLSAVNPGTRILPPWWPRPHPRGARHPGRSPLSARFRTDLTSPAAVPSTRAVRTRSPPVVRSLQRSPPWQHSARLPAISIPMQLLQISGHHPCPLQRPEVTHCSVPATDRRSSWIRLTLHSGAPVPCPPGALYIQPLQHSYLHMPRSLLHLAWLGWYARLRLVFPGAHLDERTQQQATSSLGTPSRPPSTRRLMRPSRSRPAQRSRNSSGVEANSCGRGAIAPLMLVTGA